MNKIIAILFFVLCITGQNGFSQEDKIVGSWLSEKGTSHIRVFKATNGKYYGKIEWLSEKPERKDINNPDISKQDVPIIGLMILKNVVFDSKLKQWTGGIIYDPENGKTYDCFMWFEDDPDKLLIKGYVLGMKFVGRQTSWTRVK